jgi:3'(2'), 5'-bisphosphate nucleotidase
MRQIDMAVPAPQICALAAEAGEVIMAIFRGSDPVQLANKADDSPLTRADLASHHCIAQGLQRLTPGVPVVSEEDADSLQHRRPKGSFWLVDPVDGTKEFLARNGDFRVNIALVLDGAPVWGVVHAPALGQMYWGGLVCCARRAIAGPEEPIRVAAPVAIGGRCRVVASKSHLNAETSVFIEQLGAVDLAGSSLKFCRVVEGLADMYPRMAPTCESDTAAAQAVVEGAGGHVVETQGTRLRYGKPDLLNPYFIAASVPMLQFGGRCD